MRCQAPGSFCETPSGRVLKREATLHAQQRSVPHLKNYGWWQRLFNSPELILSTYQGLGNCSGPPPIPPAPPAERIPLGQSIPRFGQRTTDVNITGSFPRFGYRLWARLVVMGNVLVKLDEGGLRSNAVPLVGISYNFRP